MNFNLSLQDRFSPRGCCFGCGPANPDGLGLKSFVADRGVVASWRGAPRFQAFPGMLNGGIIGTLLDCHSNWTAAWHLMVARKADAPPCTVTASYAVKLIRPAPLDEEIELLATVVAAGPDRATIAASLSAGGRACATCEGVFVAVRVGHPAYGRWE